MKVCVLGANGFVAKNVLRDTDWIGVTRQELDLTNQKAVEDYFNTHEYDVVIHCAVIGGSRLKPDDGEVTHKNILMFENVVRVFKGKVLYFSSGAARRGNPPTDPYGLSKWVIDRRIETIEDAYTLRIWGCYGPGELPTRFSAVSDCWTTPPTRWPNCWCFSQRKRWALAPCWSNRRRCCQTPQPPRSRHWG